MDAIVHALLIWISANTEYVIDDVSIPEVVFMSPAEITAEYYSENPELLPADGIDDRIWALYDAETNSNGSVYLRIDEQVLRDDSEQPVDIIVSGSSQSALVPVSLSRESVRPVNQAQIFEDNPVLTERLLHELVHHVQFQTGENKKFPCPAFGEKEAYKLGGLYFKKRHIEDPMPNRNFWAHMYSRC